MTDRRIEVALVTLAFAASSITAYATRARARCGAPAPGIVVTVSRVVADGVATTPPAGASPPATLGTVNLGFVEFSGTWNPQRPGRQRIVPLVPKQ